MTATRTAIREFRPLAEPDLPALRRLIEADPYVNAVIAARLSAVVSLAPTRLGGQVIALDGEDGLAAACFLGGNALPIGGDERSWPRLGLALAGRARACSALIGTADAVATLAPIVSPYWGAPRLVRHQQPLLVLDRRPGVTPDPAVRPATPDELDLYLPAAEAMFAEELDLRPLTGAAAAAYRARVAELIAGRRAFVRLDRQGRVAFKAEIGAVSTTTCQVQGVWVRPDLRGRGVATSALATVFTRALELAPTVSLYVNDFNVAARTVYARLGMWQVARLASVLY